MLLCLVNSTPTLRRPRGAPVLRAGRDQLKGHQQLNNNNSNNKSHAHTIVEGI